MSRIASTIPERGVCVRVRLGVCVWWQWRAAGEAERAPFVTRAEQLRQVIRPTSHQYLANEFFDQLIDEQSINLIN